MAEFLDTVKSYVRGHNALEHHPMMALIYSGKATPDQLKGWMKEFWVIPKTHLINNAGKLAHAQLFRGSFLTQLLDTPYDPDIVALLGEGVMDEMGKTEISPVNHYDPYWKLIDALGIPRAEVGQSDQLLPHSVLTMYVWSTTALNFSLLELLSSHNLVNDTVNVHAYPKLCEALTSHYGLSRDAVEWFDLHGEVDVEHGKRSTEVIEKIVKTAEDRETVWHAVRLGLAIKWTLFDGVYHAYVDGSYTRP